MLIYCCNLEYEAQRSFDCILNHIAAWISKKTKAPFSSDQLKSDLQNVQIGNFKIDSAASAAYDQGYPFYYCIKLTENDQLTDGRDWVTEIGLRQDTEKSDIICSILLETNEISARVDEPFSVKQPEIVNSLISSCPPRQHTPGLCVKLLTEGNAHLFKQEIESTGRRNPVIVTSTYDDTNYHLNPDRLRNLLIGLADIVAVPPNADIHKIENILGPELKIEWEGSINVIFPSRPKTSQTNNSKVYDWQEMCCAYRDVFDFEHELLTYVTHNTNHDNLVSHTSLTKVRQVKFHKQLHDAINKAKQNNDTEEYIALLDSIEEDLKSKESEISQLKAKIQQQASCMYDLKQTNKGLERSLKSTSQNPTNLPQEANDTDRKRKTITGIIKGKLTVSESLQLIAEHFPDRIIVLPSAYSSTKDSEKFEFKDKILERLWDLATAYWECLASGQGDIVAHKIFGKNGYATNDSENVTTEGQKLRTFTYNGIKIEMPKHLKIGGKFSPHQTLRVYFEWLPDEKKIIIGHCGKHLTL